MKKRKSYFDRKMESPSFRRTFERQKKLLTLELQILELLDKHHLTFDGFAKRIGTHKANVSRDLRGRGLESVSLRRLRKMAKALDSDLVALVLPRDPEARRRKLEELAAAA